MQAYLKPILGVLLATLAVILMADNCDNKSGTTIVSGGGTQPPPPQPPPPPPPKPPTTSPEVCEHEGIKQILAKLRRQCVNGVCDLDQLLSEANAIDEAAFLTLIRKAETKKTFFFNTGAETIDDDQWNNKKDELLSNLTTMVEHKDNTIAFIIAKASTKGNADKNRQISTKRAAHIQSRIDELLKANNETLKCTQMYRTYVGAELFQIDPERAQDPDYKYLLRDDVKRAHSFNEKLADYVNQSAIVFTYPCFKEMCEFMKEGLELSCEEIAEECKEITNCK
jgi:hypothetical protein